MSTGYYFNREQIYLMNKQNERAPHINEIGYHLYMQTEWYVGIDKKNKEFLRKWGDMYIGLDTIIRCVLSTGMKVPLEFHLYV